MLKINIVYLGGITPSKNVKEGSHYQMSISYFCVTIMII